METVTLGMTDLKVSRIAFGAWELGGEWGSFDQNQAIAEITKCRGWWSEPVFDASMRALAERAPATIERR